MTSRTYGSEGGDRVLEPSRPVSYLTRAITIGEKTLGPEHPDLAIWLNNLANLYKTQGKYAEAEPLLKRALAIYEQKLGPAHPSTRKIRENYASLLRDMNMQKG